MSRLLSPLVIYSLASCLAAATASYDSLWSKQFRSKINDVPQPSDDCFVCFYEQANFVGQKFCIGKPIKSCKDVNPIVAPGTIGSIKFGKGCDLVVNVRVTVVPFGENVTVISTDVANAGYDVKTSRQSVQEVYVGEAGWACFLGYPTSGTGYGACYSDNVPMVEDKYRNSFTELMLFKTAAKNFDVIAYANDYYNSPEKNPNHGDVSKEQCQRFSGYSKNLQTDEAASASGIKKTLQGKVRSIQFVAPEEDNDDNNPGIVTIGGFL